MTWMAFDGDEPITGSDFDDPGMCMLHLMQHYPCEVGRDFLIWADMRDERAGKAIRALLDVKAADDLKEDYLAFVATCALYVGYYDLIYSDFSIRTEGEE